MGRRFGLFDFRGEGGKDPIYEADELEEIAEFAALKAGMEVEADVYYEDEGGLWGELGGE